jgi:hypothetical protein
MVMSDDPFDDPIIEATAHGVAHTTGGSNTFQAFLMTFVGIPLAIWGGYTYLTEQWDQDNRTRPTQYKATEREEDKADENVELLHGEPVETVEDTSPVCVEADDEDDGGMVEEEEEPAEPPLHPEIAYARSVELKEKQPLADQGPQDAFVIEHTPAGLIAMGYDYAQKRWIYWANNTPHFRVLDTVARVYANTHNRQELYIPPAVADAANAEAEKEGAELEKIAQDSKASLFIEPTPVDAAEKPKPDKMHVANCFKRQGMLSELRFIPQGPREEPKKTSYADFLAKQNRTWLNSQT